MDRGSKLLRLRLEPRPLFGREPRPCKLGLDTPQVVALLSVAPVRGLNGGAGIDAGYLVVD